MQVPALAPKPPPSVPPQHGCPMPPQLPQEPAEHVPLTPVPVHSCPAATHMRVVPPKAASVVMGMQQPLALQELPVQQGWCLGGEFAAGSRVERRAIRKEEVSDVVRPLLGSVKTGFGLDPQFTKDRVTLHSPAVPLYGLKSYYRRLSGP